MHMVKIVNGGGLLSPISSSLHKSQGGAHHG